MGCLLAGVAALLLLAVPASIATASLAGAYLVIAVLAAGAAALTVWWTGRRTRLARAADAADDALPRSASRAAAWIGVMAVGYAAVVTIIHIAS